MASRECNYDRSNEHTGVTLSPDFFAHVTGDISMTRQGLIGAAGVALITGFALGAALGTATAQQGAPAPPAAPVPYFVGNRLGMPINPAADGKFEPMSDNVKVYGSVYSAESCSYDPERKVIVVPNRGVGQNVRTNDAW